MKTKSLIETNPYLKDPAKRKELVARSVRTSSAVEGVFLKSDANSQNKASRKKPKVHKSVAAK